MNIDKNFLQALEEKKLIKVKFNSYEKGMIERVCIPYDFAPSRNATNKTNKYQVYDLNSPSGKHNLAILPNQITSIEITETTFDPANYVTWNIKMKPWTVQRDWGIYS